CRGNSAKKLIICDFASVAPVTPVMPVARWLHRKNASCGCDASRCPSACPSGSRSACHGGAVGCENPAALLPYVRSGSTSVEQICAVLQRSSRPRLGGWADHPH